MLISLEFTALERGVLAAICDMYPADRMALECQLTTATVRSRENSGAGFYTRFEVHQGPAIQGDRMRHGPNARMGGSDHGMGFILWLQDGYAATLEGYTFGESTSAASPWDATHFEVSRP